MLLRSRSSLRLSYFTIVEPEMSAPIPQPPGVPLLGNIFDVDPNDTWSSLNKLAEKYGECGSNAEFAITYLWQDQSSKSIFLASRLSSSQARRCLKRYATRSAFERQSWDQSWRSVTLSMMHSSQRMIMRRAGELLTESWHHF